MDIQTSRLLGIIGALLMVLGILPSAGGLLILIGIIFVLVALKGYADIYKEKNIFNNAIYAIIFEIIGVVVCTIIFIYVAVDFATSLGIKNITDLNAWQQINWENTVNIDKILQYIVPIIIALVVLFAFTIFASFYFKKAMNTLSEKSGVKLFHTTGTVFFAGAILTIIAVGLIIIWVSFILLMLSFYESKPLEHSQQPK